MAFYSMMSEQYEQVKGIHSSFAIHYYFLMRSAEVPPYALQNDPINLSFSSTQRFFNDPFLIYKNKQQTPPQKNNTARISICRLITLSLVNSEN